MTELVQSAQQTGWRPFAGRVLFAVAAFATLSAPMRSSESNAVMIAAVPPAMTASQLAAPDIDLVNGENALIVDEGDAAKFGNDAIPLSGESLVRMNAFADISGNSRHYGTALRCLSQAVYYEAATESLQGQRAVAQVVLNRVRHPAYPSSVCGVVYQGWSAPVCQFSFVCDGSLRRTPGGDYWRRAQQTAEAALAGYVENSVGSATHYHADYVLPRWAYTLGKVTKIGTHIFYRLPGGPGSARNFNARWSGSERIPNIDLARFNAETLLDEDMIRPEELAPTVIPPDPTDRRAESDVGGRLDTSTGWRLEIPDPTDSSARFDRTVADHGGSTNGEEP